MRGRWISLSIPRRIVADLMYFSKGMPWIVAQRAMTLRDVRMARDAHPERPAWTALFAKAFAIVAEDIPELRRVYMRYPWPHLYEYDTSAASVVVERDFDGERGLLFARIKRPDAQSLVEISRQIRNGKGDEFVKDRHVRLLLRLASMPLLIRRAAWALALNIPRVRGNHLGTFGISTVAEHGMQIIQPRSPLTVIVTYDTIDDDGNVNVRAIFDHRVLDAMIMARALERLESVLNGAIAAELRAGAGAPRAVELRTVATGLRG